MKMFNPWKMFSTKSPKMEDEAVEQIEVPEISDVLKTVDVAPQTQKDENTMTEEIKNKQINEIVSETETEVVEDVQDVSEETEVPAEEPVEVKVVAEPKNEGEEIEPSEPETVETPIAEVEEIEPAEQEEPQPEVVEEVIEEQPAEEAPAIEEIPVEEEQEEAVAEEIQDTIEEVKDVIEVAPVVAEISVDEKASLLQEIADLKAEKAEREIAMQKMELAKEIEQDFSGVPGTVEDKVNTVYEIKNSALSEETKSFILNSLKSLSSQNVADCTEIGHEQEVEIDTKELQQNKINQAMSDHGLTENQAYLFVNGMRSLDEAIKVSRKVRRK